MKHIVFVLSGYYPYFSAVGTCVNHVVSCLKTRYHITILSVKNHCGQSDEDYLNVIFYVLIQSRLTIDFM